MKYDLFYFLNESDLCELRFELLDAYVDKFVVVEATETFSGVPRELMFDHKRYEKWKDKIIYHVVDDFPLDDMIYNMAINSPNTGSGEHYWVREFYIKESARKALKGLHYTDVVFISDVDEIWNPALTYEPMRYEVLKPKQLPYLYYLNQRTDEDWRGWSGTIVTRYHTIEQASINHLRTDDLTPYTVIENGGWHFNSIGGQEKKRNAFKHPIYEHDSEWKRREVNLRVDESDLPQIDRKKYGKYFK